MDWNLNWVPIQIFLIQLKKREMQIGGEDIENLFMNAMLEKKTLKRYRFEKTPFYVSLLGNGLNKIWAWIW